MIYLIIKSIHILSATILFGTGLGIAFFMLRGHFTDNVHEKLFAARNTVLADTIFTLPAVIMQPLTGLWLVAHSGFGWGDLWLVMTYILYILAGLCWLPVVWIQIQLKNMVIEAVHTTTSLPSRYFNLFKLWFLLGWPVFFALVIVFFLMVFKPV